MIYTTVLCYHQSLRRVDGVSSASVGRPLGGLQGAEDGGSRELRDILLRSGGRGLPRLHWKDTQIQTHIHIRTQGVSLLVKVMVDWGVLADLRTHW